MSEAPEWTDHHTDMFVDLLTVSEAATAYHVTEARIRQWKKRGHIEPAGMDEFGRLLYRGIDVLRAETAAQERLTATQGRLVATRGATRQS